MTVELSERNSKKDTEEFDGLGAFKCLIATHLTQREIGVGSAHTCFIHA